MSGSHPSDPAQHEDANPVALAIKITLGTVSVIIGIILLAQLAVGFYGSRSREGDPSMAPAAVERRIAPVAQVAIDPSAPAAPAQPAAAAPAPAAAPAIPPPAAPAKVAAAAGGNGKSTYDATCAVCHAAGVAGAPKPGDQAAWAPRLAAGKDALYASAIKGKGAMPPKGGNAALSDDAVKAAVDHLLATVQ